MDKKKELEILDGQLLVTAIFMFSLTIAIILIINQRNRLTEKDPLISDKNAQDLAVINKIIILCVVLYALYLSYESYLLGESQNKDTKNLELQFIAGLLTVIVAIIALYVTLSDVNKQNLTLAELETP